MQKLLAILAGCAVLVVAGCSATSSVQIGAARPPTSPGQVKIYLRPPPKYDEISLLEASSENSWAFTRQGEMDKVIERLKREAAKLGANGVLLQGTGTEYGGSVSTGSAVATAYGTGAYATGTGVSVPVTHKVGTAIAIWAYEDGSAADNAHGPASSDVEAARMQDMELPAGTSVYISLGQEVTSKRGEYNEGDEVVCQVWRDVVIDSVPVLKAGTPAKCKIDDLRRRYIAGIEGKISIAAIETTAADGQKVLLTGGYNQAGSGRKTLVVASALVIWPLLFVPGGSAELQAGAVFQASTLHSTKIAGTKSTAGVASVNLKGLLGEFKAQFMIDDFVNAKNPDNFKIKIEKSGDWPSRFVVDNVNDKSVDPIPLEIIEKQSTGSETTAVAAVGIKTLGRHFQRGINRFQVAYDDAGHRVSQEVIVDVEM